MKREVFLSFKPEYFKPILYGMKKYEYRKRFCKEATISYLYLSTPVQKVIGIMELDSPILIDEIMRLYSEETAVWKRAKQCMNIGERLAMPIISLQLFKTPVTMLRLKQIDPSFRAPRSYLYINKYENIHQFLKSQDLYDIEFTNAHDTLYIENLGMTCDEMRMTNEYKEKDILYKKETKYNTFKSIF